MKIAVNCVGWAEDMRGVDRYYVELISALLKIDDRNTYIIFTGAWQKYMDRFNGRNNVLVISVQWSSRRILRNIWHGFVFPDLVKKYDPDIVHLPNTMPLFKKVCPTVCTIHDLLEYTYPQTFGFIQTRMRRIIVRGEINRADHIIAVSDLAADSLTEILRVPGNRITTIYSGVDHEAFRPSDTGFANARRRFNIRKKYILFVSVIDRKKNAVGLLRAYHRLPDTMRQEYQLVFAGKPDNAYAETIQLTNDLGLKDQVMFLQQVEQGLPVLYQGASLFVMPSFYEGFGLPVLEAMASGVPVVASREVAIARKLEDQCLLVDPGNIEDMAAKMSLLLSSSKLRDKYIKDGLAMIKEYSWKKSAAQTLEVYRKCGMNVSNSA